MRSTTKSCLNGNMMLIFCWLIVHSSARPKGGMGSRNRQKAPSERGRFCLQGRGMPNCSGELLAPPASHSSHDVTDCHRLRKSSASAPEMFITVYPC